MHITRPELNYDVQTTKDKNEYLLKNITEMKKSDSLSNEQAGIVFTMHANNFLGCLEVEQNIKKFNKNISTGIFSGDKPRNWHPQNKDIIKEYKKASTDNEKQRFYDYYKKSTQKEFKNNKIQLMCATKSFGMGINKPNIRFSIHYGMPASMESLYQETGRTGRDGKRAKNVILRIEI